MNEVYIDDNNKVRCTARFGPDHELGDLVTTEDGYAQFFPDLSRGGYWPTWMLRNIADVVDTRNQEWAKFILKDLSKHEAS